MDLSKKLSAGLEAGVENSEVSHPADFSVFGLYNAPFITAAGIWNNPGAPGLAEQHRPPATAAAVGRHGWWHEDSRWLRHRTELDSLKSQPSSAALAGPRSVQKPKADRTRLTMRSSPVCHLYPSTAAGCSTTPAVECQISSGSGQSTGTAECGGKFLGYANSFARLKNVIINRNFCSGKRGGEDLSTVMHQSEQEEYIKVKDGCFQLSCPGTFYIHLRQRRSSKGLAAAHEV